MPRHSILADGLNRTESTPAAMPNVDASEKSRVALARYVIDRREEVGLTQSELAERAGLTRSLVNAIERSKIGLPGIDKRRALAEALRVRHIDLLVAAGEITRGELGASTPREFTHYPELQRDIESLSPDAADALHDFMFFLVKSPAIRGGFQRPAARAEWLSAWRSQSERLHKAASDER